MLKFFRKIRFNSIDNHKAIKYFLYALGEISLVLIGILLALQINSRNAAIKDSKQIDDILEVIHNDLEADLKQAKWNQSYYDNKLLLIDSIVFSKLQRERYNNCFKCFTNHTFHRPFSPNTKGYNMLVAIAQDNNIRKDTLIGTILSFYSEMIDKSIQNNKLILENAVENNKYYRDNFDGFSQFYLNQKLTKDLVERLLEDKKILNQMAFHHVIIQYNMLPFLKGVNKEGQRIKTMIENLKTLE